MYVASRRVASSVFAFCRGQATREVRVALLDEPLSSSQRFRVKLLRFLPRGDFFLLILVRVLLVCRIIVGQTLR